MKILVLTLLMALVSCQPQAIPETGVISPSDCTRQTGTKGCSGAGPK